MLDDVRQEPALLLGRLAQTGCLVLVHNDASAATVACPPRTDGGAGGPGPGVLRRDRGTLTSLRRSSQSDCVVAQALETLVGYKVVVLDPYPADAWHVQPRFERDDIASEQGLAGIADEERRLGMRQTESVS